MRIKFALFSSIFFLTIHSFSQQIGDGYAPGLTDFTLPLLSGVYGYPNPLGGTPDTSHPWQHLFVIRHANPNNNHQLQIASSFNTNDRLFFRKLAGGLEAMNPSWIEIATRGTNNFIGNQNIAGKLETLNTSPGITSFKTAGINAYMLIDNVGSGENYYSANNFHDFQIGGISKMRINSNGNVGIGTTSPTVKLDVQSDGVAAFFRSTINSVPVSIINDGASVSTIGFKGSTSLTEYNVRVGADGNDFISYTSNVERMRINSNGNLGIGTVSPQTKLDVNGIIQTYNKDSNIATWDNLRIWSEGENGIIEANGDEKGLIIRSNTGNKILLMNNVGIGISNPTNKLDVNGTIHSKEVKVDMNGWSDFVFKREYNLPTLEEVEKQITEKGHLANIPNEEEVLKNGINLGEMNAKLLQKIEEMTLYMIEQNKKIKNQEKEIIELKKDNTDLLEIKKRLTILENKS